MKDNLRQETNELGTSMPSSSLSRNGPHNKRPSHSHLVIIDFVLAEQNAYDQPVVGDADDALRYWVMPQTRVRV